MGDVVDCLRVLYGVVGNLDYRDQSGLFGGVDPADLYEADEGRPAHVPKIAFGTHVLNDRDDLHTALREFASTAFELELVAEEMREAVDEDGAEFEARSAKTNRS